MDIWPHRETASSLTRVFPLLGRHDDSGRTKEARPASGDPGSRTTAARPTKAPDRDVQPAGGVEDGGRPDPAPSVARKPLRLSPGPETPALLPTPIAVNLPAGLHDRPSAAGPVGLQVFPYDLPPLSDQAEYNVREPSDSPAETLATARQPEPSMPEAPARATTRREEHLMPAAAGTEGGSPLTVAVAPQGGGSPAAQPPSQPPAPPIEGLKETSPPAASQPPGPVGRPPSTKPATPRAMPESPAPRPTAPAQPAEESPRPAGPAPRAPQATPAPAATTPPEPASAPAPAAATTPRPLAPSPEPPVAVPAVQEVPTTPQAATPALAPTPVSSPQRTPATTTPGLASPQTSPGGTTKVHAQHHKRLSLLTWVRSLHQPEPDVQPHLPPALFPTTYQACVPAPACKPAPQPSSQRCQPPVLPAPQHALQPATAKAPTKTCFSWVGKGPVTGFFRKLKSLGKGCGCSCAHCSRKQGRAAPGPCGGGCTTGNCGSIAPPTASPQASSAWAPRSSPLSLLDTEPRDVTQGGQVLERLAAQGLDKPAQ
jgi:hypothetical protein